jgi:HD-GYP domain-containing protein (c-di-GMP phosphodiesterase class II)
MIIPEKKYIKLKEKLRRFNEIGVALSAEKNIDKLLEIILNEAKTLTNSDAGTLYLMIDNNMLSFEIMRTDSLNIQFGGVTAPPVPKSIYPVKLYDSETKEPNNHNVSAYTALTGKTVNITDAYEEKGFDFSGTRGFDEKNGYRSTSFLNVPMKNHENDVIGVLQLINAIDTKSGDIVSFNEEMQEDVESLASQAAVALTNRKLVEELKNLFESFIKLIASAIDAKSPYTGGHCSRVPDLTMLLAKAVEKENKGPYKNFVMSEDEEYELSIAAWLHDCGKVTTPEYVMDKATKLETIVDRIDIVKMRFEVLKRDAEISLLKQKLAHYENGSSEKFDSIQDKYQKDIESLESDLAFIEKCNIGGEFMKEEFKDKIRHISKHSLTVQSKSTPLLGDDEVLNLNIARGTINESERKIMMDHIVQTINMLEQLPYPKSLANIPEYAGGHHEKINGKGYPKGLTGEQMPTQAKIMAIADVFESLTASDRPYKKANTLSQALRILSFMRNDGEIDPDLFAIFVKNKIYLEYAKNHLPKEQIDEVNINDYL